MKTTETFRFKVATEQSEIRQIHGLNYQTFVDEIPQHDPNDQNILVDQFHKENTYIVCLKDDNLVGMVAYRDRRPFSLDKKLDNLDSYLPPGTKVCEIRLLAIENESRKGPVLQGLLTMLAKHCINQGMDVAIVSANVKRMRFYKNLGFISFGPVVGTPEAQFQPMYRDIATVEDDFQHLFRPQTPHPRSEKINFLPGPVNLNKNIKDALLKPPLSHRSPNFISEFQKTKQVLCDLVGAANVEVMMGGGTLANDVVGYQISLLPGRGLILSNGEFGDRLIGQAKRLGLFL